MAGVYKHDYAAFGVEVLQADFMVAEMLRRAEKVKAFAEAIAPVGDPATDPHSGRYKESFSVESGVEGEGRHRRAFGRVINSSPDAVLVEYVNGDHVMSRALDAAGDD